MLTDVALVEFHESFTTSPFGDVARTAVKERVGASLETPMVTDWDWVPFGPVTVPVNVVGLLTTTVLEPASARPSPSSPTMFGLTVNLVAFAVDQFSVTTDPAGTVEALAENLRVGVLLAVVLMLSDCCVEPPRPWATAMNFVSAETVTFLEPESGNAFSPWFKIEGVMVTAVAFWVFQVSVIDPPTGTDAWFAEKVRLGTEDCGNL